MRHLQVVILGLLMIGHLGAQNRCYAWYDVDTVPSLFGGWVWNGWTQPQVYYIRPGGDYIWLGSRDTALST